MSHPRHGSLKDADYHRYFSAPIVFGCKSNSVLLPKDIFSREILNSSSELKYVITEISSRQLKALTNSVTVTQKVNALAQSGLYNIDKVAAKLMMSTRTLQRRLQDENAVFKNLVSDVKKSKADAYLKSRQYSIQEISFLLGYQNERAFYDAVQRWFGTSPTGVIEKAKL